MSAPGSRTPQGDFLATRGKAAAGPSGIDFLNQIAGGGGDGAQTVQPAPTQAAPAAAGGSGSTAAPPPASPSQPFGLTVDNFMRARVQGQKTALDAEAAAQPKTMSAAFLDATSSAWAAVQKDFAASHAVQDSPVASTAFQKQGFWDQAKTVFQQQMAAGKLPLDAIKLALSPVAGAASAATAGVDEGVQKLLGKYVPSGAVKTVLDQALPLLGPEAGELGAAAKAGEGADTLAQTPKPPPAGPGAKVAPDGAAMEKPATGAPGVADEGLKAPPVEAPPRAFDIAGEEPGADLKVTPELRQKASDFLQGKGSSPIDVHLEALADPATRADAVMQISKLIPKGAVKPLDVSEMGAYALNITPDEMMEQIRPKFASDELWMGAAMAQNSASEVFWNAARKATQTGAPEDTEAAVRAYTQFNNYSGAFLDAKTDWGRAGRVQQVAMGARDDFTKHIQAVADYAGRDNIEEIIRKTADLDDPRKVSPFVASMRWMGGRDGFMYGWYNWLLSHAVIPKKLVSDASLAALNIGTRYAAEKFGSGAIAPGETGALVQGYLGSMKDALRAAGKAFKSGQSQFQGDYQSLFDGHFFDRGGKLADGTPGPFEPGSTTAAALEYLRMAMPTSAIAAADDFAKVSNYRAELHAMAFRSATGAAGGDPAAFATHYDTLINNVQPAMHDQAVAAALRNTLQEPLDGIGAALQGGLDMLNIPVGRTGVEIPLGRILVPFTKIATNSMRLAYRSSPLPYAMPSDAWRASMAAGGAKRDLAQAQAGLGTAVSMLGMTLWAGSKLTGAGPSAPDERAAWLRAGNKPYHLQIGGVSTPYNHIEPLATTLGVLADTGDLMRYAHEDDNSQLAVSLGLGIGHAMLDKTYMSTISQLMEAMDAPDQKGQRFAQSFLSGLAVPGEVSMVQRVIDPWLRSHNDLMSSIKARTPGFSSDLPPVRNLWGDPINRENDWIPAISQGVKTGAGFGPDENAEPIDQWIWKNRANFPDGDQGRLGLTTPPRTLSFDVGQGDPVHIPLSLPQIDKLRTLAGNGAKDPSTGLGAKDALNALVQGKSPNEALQSQFNSATPQRQALMVLNQWSKYRAGAKAQLLHEDAGLRDQITQAKDGRRALVAPTMGGTP